MKINKILGDAILDAVLEYIKANYSIEATKSIKCLDICTLSQGKSTIKLRILYYQPEAEYIKNYYQIYLKLIDQSTSKQHNLNEEVIGYIELDNDLYTIRDLARDRDFLQELFGEIEKKSLLKGEEEYLGDNFGINLVKRKDIKLSSIQAVVASSPRYLSIFCGDFIVKIFKTIQPVSYTEKTNVSTWNLANLSTKLILPLQFILTFSFEGKKYLMGYASNYYTDAINMGEIAKNSLRAFYSSKDIGNVNITPQFIQIGATLAELHNNIESVNLNDSIRKQSIKKSDFIRDINIILHRLGSLDTSKIYDSHFTEVVDKVSLPLIQKYDSLNESLLCAGSLGNCNLYQMLKISNRVVMRNIYTYRSLLSMRSTNVYNNRYWDLGNVKQSVLWYAYLMAVEFVGTTTDLPDIEQQSTIESAEKWVDLNWKFFLDEYKKNANIFKDVDDIVIVHLIGIVKLLDDSYIYSKTLQQNVEQKIIDVYKNMMNYYIRAILASTTLDRTV